MLTPEMRALRGSLVFGFVASIVASACAEESPTTVLQAQDLAPVTTEDPFDHNNILEPAAFTDIETIELPAIQRFLHKTPYERPSFLETYQSNGVRAADAIANAARQYRINPLVLLVFAQITQGLIGERNYPFPVNRVEYVFRCGCLQNNECLPHLAGFDRQVDCLGRALREAIDAVRSSEQKTASGWGPNVTSTTLDGVKVTPANDATAAFYDRNPRVHEGAAGGSWVFWNVFHLYAPKLDYAGPVGAIDGRWIGEPCAVDEACALDGATCATNYPGGMCTLACKGTCPSQPSKPETFCAKFRDGGFCFPKCNPQAPQCRNGYKCVRVAGANSSETTHVCTPDASAEANGTTEN